MSTDVVSSALATAPGIDFHPIGDERLVARGVDGRGVIDDAPDSIGRLAHALDGRWNGKTLADREHRLQQPELACLDTEIHSVTSGDRHPHSIGLEILDLLDVGGIVLGSEGREKLALDRFACGGGSSGEFVG